MKKKNIIRLCLLLFLVFMLISLCPTDNKHIPKDRKYLFIGDSYAAGSHLNAGEIDWTGFVKNNLGLIDNVSYFKYAVGGTGFVVNSPYNYNDVLAPAISEMTPEQKNSITDVVVGGGANDSSATLENLKKNIKVFMSTVKKNYPNARVWIIPIGWDVHSSFRQMLETTYDYYAKLSSLGYTYVDNCYSVMQNSDRIFSDGCHPIEQGDYAIGKAVTEALLNSSEYVAADTGKSTEFMIDTHSAGSAYIKDKILHLHLNSNTFNIASCSIRGDFAKIANVSCDVFLGGETYDDDCFTCSTVITAGGKQYNEAVTYSIKREEDGHLGLYAKMSTENDDTSQNYSAITALSFSESDYTFSIFGA